MFQKLIGQPSEIANPALRSLVMSINRKCYFTLNKRIIFKAEKCASLNYYDFFAYTKNGLPLSLSTFSVAYSYFLFLTDWLFDISVTQTNTYFSLSLSILLNSNIYLKGGKRMMQVCHIDYHGLGGSWLLIAALILSFHFNFIIFHINFFESLIHCLGQVLGAVGY